MAWYQPGRTLGAPRRPIEEELNDLDVSMDDISVGGVSQQNKQINKFFSDDDCCKDNKYIIESNFRDNLNKSLYLFVNDKKTHYILFENPIKLDKIHKPKPLIIYSTDNDYYFTIIHNNIAYFFMMTNDETIKLLEYVQLSHFKSKHGKDLFFCLYREKYYILFKKDENNDYIAASEFIDLIRNGNYIIIYDGNGIIYNGVKNTNGTFRITEGLPPSVFSSFKTKRSTKRSNKRSTKRSKSKKNNAKK